jgi:hypothetical protein
LYLKFGGLPAAVAEAATGAANPSEQVKRVLYDSLVKEIQRRGASIPASHALLERVLRSLGSRTDWSKMAREMDVPLANKRRATSHHTLRDYIELLASGYFLFILYSWRAGSHTNSVSNEKKVFFADPLLHTIALDLVPGILADVKTISCSRRTTRLFRPTCCCGRLVEPQRAPCSTIAPCTRQPLSVKVHAFGSPRATPPPLFTIRPMSCRRASSFDIWP